MPCCDMNLLQFLCKLQLLKALCQGRRMLLCSRFIALVETSC